MMMQITLEEQQFLNMPEIDMVEMYSKIAFHRMRHLMDTEFDYDDPGYESLTRILKNLKALMKAHSEDELDYALNELIEVCQKLAYSPTIENQIKVDEMKRLLGKRIL